MVTNITDFGVALDELLRHWVPLVRRYLTYHWEIVHSLAQREGADEIVFGIAAERWLPSPSKACLATLAGIAEERGDPAFIQEVAAVIQRAAMNDPTCKAHFLELCSAIEDLGRIEEGCAALRKRREMTVRTVSAKIKRSSGVISRYEQGDREIGSRDLLKYLKAVRASFADLHDVMRVLRMLRSGSEWEPEPSGDSREEKDQ